MDSFEKMDEAQLPPKEAFYSKLTDSNISDEDYEHAQNVWRNFNIRTMRDSHNLYAEYDPAFPTPILFTRHDSNYILCISDNTS